jgi:thiol-disulfide isomerase/thioredoxin
MSQIENPVRALSTSRRRLIGGAVAVSAGLAGAGLAWWRFTPDETAGGVPGKLWELEFELPTSGKLAVAGLRGRPLLINFWATWCPPCIEELPLLDSFYRQNAANGWQVLGLAIDKKNPVQDFLRRMPVSFPMAMAGIEGIELTRSLGNTAGGLPFSVLLGADGRVLKRKIGKISAQELSLWRELK